MLSLTLITGRLGRKMPRTNMVSPAMEKSMVLKTSLTATIMPRIMLPLRQNWVGKSGPCSVSYTS